MKPIIRHCRNCEYAKHHLYQEIDCDVKYIKIRSYEQRRKGLLCRFFKAKECETNE